MLGDLSQRMRPNAEPPYSRSLEYGLVLLECFTAMRPAWQISELADMLNMNRSTVHRYAKTLVALGHLEQDERRRYRLAHKAGIVGRAMIDTIRLETPAAQTILEDLREQTSHTVSIGALDGVQVIYTHRLFAHGSGQFEADLELGVGARVPAHRTAIGKALLASLSEPDQHAMLALITADQGGSHTFGSEQALVEELTRIRADGIAICDEEQVPGVRVIAAAIPYPGRSWPIAVSVTVPAGLGTVKTTTTVGMQVRAAAERI